METGNWIEDFREWLEALPADFAFLLVLPFIVALAGLLRYAAERERRTKQEQHAHVHTEHRRWSRQH